MIVFSNAGNPEDSNIKADDSDILESDDLNMAEPDDSAPLSQENEVLILPPGSLTQPSKPSAPTQLPQSPQVASLPHQPLPTTTLPVAGRVLK